MKRIKLVFDKRTHSSGSKEHFWHFLLGYLLPSVNFYFNSPNNQNTNKIQLIYEDCGPLMNPMIKEITQLLNIPFDILNKKNQNQKKQYDDIVYPSRWDIRLFTGIYFLINKNRYNSNIKIEAQDIKWFINKNFSFRRKAFGINLKKDILFVRNLILKKINNLERPKIQPYLFLDRSDLHEYYAPTGNATIKG